MNKLDIIEWLGTACAMIASGLVATNTLPGIGYIFYLLSTVLIGYVVWKLKRKGLFFLQGYFIIINLVGIYTFLLK